MKLEEVQKCALQLPDADRAVLAAELLNSLPAVLMEDDQGVAEARRRFDELDTDASASCSWDEIKKDLGR